MGYPPIAVLKIPKEWKIAITLVSQEYKSTEGRQDYKMGTRKIYRGRGILMDIRKAENNFDKDRRPKCFNCNAYRYIVKDCRRLKKEWDARKYYKYKKIRHIARDCKSG